MDVIEASHLERIKKHLDKNPDHEFTATKSDGVWFLCLNNYATHTIVEAVLDSSFAEAVKRISNYIAGDESNGSND